MRKEIWEKKERKKEKDGWKAKRCREVSMYVGMYLSRSNTLHVQSFPFLGLVVVLFSPLLCGWCSWWWSWGWSWGSNWGRWYVILLGSVLLYVYDVGERYDSYSAWSGSKTDCLFVDPIEFAHPHILLHIVSETCWKRNGSMHILYTMPDPHLPDH